MRDKIKAMKDQLTRKEPKKRYLKTGSQLLDLACSGKSAGGYIPGHYYYFVGDSGSGKTWFVFSALAEAANNPDFDGYDLYYDGPEYGGLMNKTRFFGKKLAHRLKFRDTDDMGNPVSSTCLEDFYDFVDGLLEMGKPFVCILDSLDSLRTRSELQALAKARKAAKKAPKARQTSVDGEGNKPAGSYGTEKAKINSVRLPSIVSGLQKTGSIMLLISQTRQRIGWGAQYNPRTKSGGEAPTFYASLEIWTSIQERIKRRVNGKDRTIGRNIKIVVKKNRVSGWDNVVHVPIYPSHGIDDTGSLVNFLILEKHWDYSEKGDKITAPEFDFVGKKEGLITKIEHEGLTDELSALVTQVWRSIQAECSLERKPRYS